MRIGFLTNSIAWQGIKDLTEIAHWAVKNEFDDLEVGPTIPLNEKDFNDVLEQGKVTISGLIYCRNFLDNNEEEALKHRNNLKERIQFAGKMGIEKIILSTGTTKETMLKGNPLKYDPQVCLDDVMDVFKDFVELAEKNNVKLCLENCPMMGNISISPYMWDLLFDKICSDKIGLAYDPSHLIWQFIDPYDNILRYPNKIFHVHGKDCQIDYATLNRVGILHNFNQSAEGSSNGENRLKKMWWRYRLPGLGDIDWSKIVANLEEIGYTGTISIEHEDPVWEGNLEKVEIGLLKAKKHIKNFLVYE